MSTRRGAWVVNRIGAGGWPNDMMFINPVTKTIQKYCPSLVNWQMERQLNDRFNHENYSLRPTHRPLRN